MFLFHFKYKIYKYSFIIKINIDSFSLALENKNIEIVKLLIKFGVPISKYSEVLKNHFIKFLNFLYSYQVII